MKNKIKNWLLCLLIKHFDLKVWGVDFAPEKPPEFIITDHARRRLLKRFRCNKTKIKKIIVKAWRCKEAIENKKLYKLKKYNKGKQYTFRSFMGYIFVFAYDYRLSTRPPQKILITLYHPKINFDVNDS